MAFRWLIYSTGTTFAETIVRESATNDSGVNEAGLFSDFVIPEIQPLYLWRVTGDTTVVPNTDANINAYLDSIAPPPEPQDDATVGFVTGITSQKIDTVSGATEDNVAIFTDDGNVQDSGFAISSLTADTKYNFTGSGGTNITTGSTSGVIQIIISSAVPTGTTVAWGDITGTLSNQTDLQNALNAKLDVTAFNSYTGTTQTALNNKLETSAFNSYTGTTQPVIDAALTGVTNLGTGTTLGGVSGRNATIKSISVLGGLSLSGDADNLVISGQTGGTSSVAWGEITGTLSNQTDLQNALDAKLDETDFNTFTGTTLPANYYNKTEINSYTATTESAINAKLDTTDFNTFTGTTLPANYYNKTEINSYTGITDSRIDALEALTGGTLTGASNGLVTNGQVVELGGGLTRDTLISGTTHDFTVNTQTIKLQGVNGIDIIDTDGVGGINIESDAGTVAIIGNNNVGTEQTKLEISETSMLITDSRTTKVGMQYAADYSASFTNESLITKRYADSIAQGLTPKAGVIAATTANIDLTGGTFGGTVDGYTVQDGDRILVKDQTDASQNGIWVYSGSSTTFYRAADFNGDPSGEVVQGDLVPVISGDTQFNTIWVLITPDPITVGTDDLDFTLFSNPAAGLIGGVGIDISGNTINVDGSSLAGNSIAWTGNTFNVDVNSGTLATALGSKLDTSVFNTFTGTTLPANYYNKTEINAYTGTTATLIGTKLDETVFNTFTGTTLPANYYNKTEINAYTGATDTRLDNIEADITGLTATTANKLDTAVFTGYTASTSPNEFFLIHTGGTDINTVAATAIDWDTVQVSGSNYVLSGTSDIVIQVAGDYELSYNIPYNSTTNRKNIGIGANVILNNSTVLDVTAAAGLATDNGIAANIALPPVILTLAQDDILTLAAFRTGDPGATLTSPNASILIKKKQTLQ